MSLIAIVLVFIMAIVVTVFLSHLLPVKVPLPLIQIAAGAALAQEIVDYVVANYADSNAADIGSTPDEIKADPEKTLFSAI